MWRHLRHPNILPLLAATSDTFEDQEPKLAFVSRWMENGNINCFIKKNDVNRVRLVRFLPALCFRSEDQSN